MKALTKTQKAAIDWLRDRGGEGVIDKTGHVVARGERSNFDAVTWLRLLAAGELEGFDGRVMILEVPF